MVAMDKCEQGKGYSGGLLADALKPVAAARRSLGVSIAVLDVRDDGDARAVKRRAVP